MWEEQRCRWVPKNWRKIREYFEWYPWTLSPTSSIFIILSSTLGQQMVNCWFGARWFGFLGSPYERDCYLRAPWESQTTNPNQQLIIRDWMDAKIGFSWVYWRVWFLKMFLMSVSLDKFRVTAVSLLEVFPCWRLKRSSSQRILAFLCCFFFKRYVSANG